MGRAAPYIISQGLLKQDANSVGRVRVGDEQQKGQSVLGQTLEQDSCSFPSRKRSWELSSDGGRGLLLSGHANHLLMLAL